MTYSHNRERPPDEVQNANKFVDGSPRLAATVREVDGNDSFLPPLLFLLPVPR